MGPIAEGAAVDCNDDSLAGTSAEDLSLEPGHTCDTGSASVNNGRWGRGWAGGRAARQAAGAPTARTPPAGLSSARPCRHPLCLAHAASYAVLRPSAAGARCVFADGSTRCCSSSSAICYRRDDSYGQCKPATVCPGLVLSSTPWDCTAYVVPGYSGERLSATTGTFQFPEYGAFAVCYRVSGGAWTHIPASGDASDGSSRISTIEPCPVGTFADQSATDCSDCPAGFHQDTPGEASCEACPAGYRQALTGETSCEGVLRRVDSAS